MDRAETGGAVKVVAFDFGGVIAEEGFRNGLMAIGERTSMGAEGFFEYAREQVYALGYAEGKGEESDWWRRLRQEVGLREEPGQLRKEILDRFILRPGMLDLVGKLRSGGLRVVILSDQTNWLDELDERDHFFSHFDAVFNSYHVGKSKRDRTIFADLCQWLGCEPAEVVFIDDSSGHVDRAREMGVDAILFQSEGDCRRELQRRIGSLS